MESVGILRALWRRRALVALGALLAILVGVSALYRISLSSMPQKRETLSAFSVERLLVDTPNSLVADAQAPGAASIVIRAILLGDLLSSPEARATIAREAGLSPAEIDVIGPSTTVPEVATPLAEKAIEVTRPGRPYIVTVGQESNLPILSVRATAPSPEEAAKLTRATTATLDALGGEGQATGGDVAIEPIAKAQTGAIATSPGKTKAVGLAMVVFFLWCVAIVVFDRFLRRARRSSAPLPELGT